MAFFKFRKGDDDAIAAPAQPESVEALRRRARQRLIGAAVLVLAGVVGFPLLFDTQPRPVAVDIPIEIPDRNKARPLATAAPPDAKAANEPPAPITQGPVEPAPAAVKAAEPAPPASGAARVERVEPAPPVATDPAPRPESRTEGIAAKQAPEDGARARALLEGKAARPQEAEEDRFVVQVGAFADAGKAREARLKLERAGLKTYTHVAETREGKRIRVRAGPFASRAEADKAAQKIKSLELPAAILTL